MDQAVEQNYAAEDVEPEQEPPDSPEPEEQHVAVYDPEEGWDDQTDPYCEVLEYGEDKEVMRLASTAKMFAPKPAAHGAFYYQKILGDGDVLAAGQLIIPPGSTKPVKSVKDSTYIFYVIQGAVRFTVHKGDFVLANGACFMVPRGNVYRIQNVCDRDAKLFFAQARKMPEEPKDAVGEGETADRARSHSTAVATGDSADEMAPYTANTGKPQKPKSRRGKSAMF
ncbi:hypothetical protein FKP32DRAFT_495829 [Trametes sanguinea]|nr:hypothetical protein FKP32DRAFT_495829 [Trametes sanguinea]